MLTRQNDDDRIQNIQKTTQILKNNQKRTFCITHFLSGILTINQRKPNEQLFKNCFSPMNALNSASQGVKD
jgi:hypothetical protein